MPRLPALLLHHPHPLGRHPPIHRLAPVAVRYCADADSVPNRTHLEQVLKINGRLHPLSIVSFAAFVAAVVLPFTSAYGAPFSPRAVLAFMLLGSCFAVLFVGHLFIQDRLRRHFLLAIATLPLLICWQMVMVVMWYMALGMTGASIFGPGLSLLAAVLVIVLSAGEVKPRVRL